MPKLAAWCDEAPSRGLRIGRPSIGTKPMRKSFERQGIGVAATSRRNHAALNFPPVRWDAIAIAAFALIPREKGPSHPRFIGRNKAYPP